MKVFLSWSTEPSKQLASILRAWLPEVIQEVKPWMSSVDIPKGDRWSPSVESMLAQTSQGIICVTPGNSSQPWLNFEAGAVAKSLETSRVHPLLLGLRATDLVGPLTLFQATNATDHNDMRLLISSLNEACEDPLPSNLLERSFDRMWGEYEAKVGAISADPPPNTPVGPRPESDVLEEILEVVRALQRGAVAAATPGPTSVVASRERQTGPSGMSLRRDAVDGSDVRFENQRRVVDSEVELALTLQQLAEIEYANNRRTEGDALLEQSGELQRRARSRVEQLRKALEALERETSP